MLIDRIGHRGDGIAESAAGPVYVPFALPGERVTARLGRSRGRGIAAEAMARANDAPERVAPPCDLVGVAVDVVVRHPCATQLDLAFRPVRYKMDSVDS